MKAWLDLLSEVKLTGQLRNDRTGVGTLALFGKTLEVDNSTHFPAVTTKQLMFKQVAAELACFLRGYSHLEDFHNMGCTIWDGNGMADYWLPSAREEGDLGRIYGVQWRDWLTVRESADGVLLVKRTDQLKALMVGLENDPHGRRHVVTAYNPGELDQMCLPPCHLMFQVFIRDNRSLEDSRPIVDVLVYMRSVDLFIGLPFDIASYAVLQRLIAQTLGYVSGRLTFMLGDAHIYLNHLEQVDTVLSRTPLPGPTLAMTEQATVFDMMPSELRLDNYNHHGAVPAPLNV